MTDKSTTQTKSPRDYTLPFDAMAAVDAWKKVTDETLNQVATWLEESGKLQANGLETLNHAMEERARWFNDSLKHAARVSDEWRQMAVNATRRAAELLRNN